MAQQITQLLDEKCEVLETLSQCQQEVSVCYCMPRRHKIYYVVLK